MSIKNTPQITDENSREEREETRRKNLYPGVTWCLVPASLGGKNFHRLRARNGGASEALMKNYHEINIATEDTL